MAEQKILVASEDYVELDDYFGDNDVKSIFLVCDSSMPFLRISKYFDYLKVHRGIEVVKFSNFKPNPFYESVVEGVKLFYRTGCDMIVAVGGGSTIDVAKCIKLFSNMNTNKNYLTQQIIPNDLKFLAVPTTAGTGSEATRYAVIYYNGDKQSVTDYSCIPSTVLMDASALKTLPIYQKKSTMMDALCHSIESYWSVNSTEESNKYSKQAIQTILENKDAYLANKDLGNANMLKAAYLAGKAINITQTTAGHAMSYKLTSLYGIAHGHAVAICISKLWEYMLEHPERCIDSRGIGFLNNIYCEIADSMGCVTVPEAVTKYKALVDSLNFINPQCSPKDYLILKTSVNPIRLKNHPIYLDEDIIESLYHPILQ